MARASIGGAHPSDRDADLRVTETARGGSHPVDPACSSPQPRPRRVSGSPATVVTAPAPTSAELSAVAESSISAPARIRTATRATAGGPVATGAATSLGRGRVSGRWDVRAPSSIHADDSRRTSVDPTQVAGGEGAQVRILSAHSAEQGRSRGAAVSATRG
ncbi:hypothetical protein GCM10027261_21150 [Geodermatophilus arenarius]